MSLPRPSNLWMALSTWIHLNRQIRQTGALSLVCHVPSHIPSFNRKRLLPYLNRQMWIRKPSLFRHVRKEASPLTQASPLIQPSRERDDSPLMYHIPEVRYICYTLLNQHFTQVELSSHSSDPEESLLRKKRKWLKARKVKKDPPGTLSYHHA